MRIRTLLEAATAIAVWLLCVPPGKPPNQDAPMFEWISKGGSGSESGCAEMALKAQMEAARGRDENEQMRIKDARCVNAPDDTQRCAP
jgi:hypothetical protein